MPKEVSHELMFVLSMDALLCVSASLMRLLCSRHHDTVPLWCSVPGLLLALFLHHTAATRLFAVTTGMDQATALFVVVALGFIPGLSYGVLVMGGVADLVVELFMGGKSFGPLKRLLGRARAQRARNNAEGALREYRRYFEAEPDDPAPLTEAANWLAVQQRYDEAADLFLEIMRRFKGDDQVWSAAAYRLADLRDNYFNDPWAAATILRQISSRTPHSELGNLAQERLTASGL